MPDWPTSSTIVGQEHIRCVPRLGLSALRSSRSRLRRMVVSREWQEKTGAAWRVESITETMGAVNRISVGRQVMYRCTLRSAARGRGLNGQPAGSKSRLRAWRGPVVFACEGEIMDVSINADKSHRRPVAVCREKGDGHV